MRKRIPAEEAFQYYLSLGPSRSYEQVAQQFGASLRGVTKCAGKHKWSARMAKIDRDAQERTEKEFAESKAETRERHLKVLKAIEMQGLAALQKFPIDSGFAGVKAVEAAIKLQRVIMGEPSTQVGVTVMENTKREIEQFIARADEPEDDDDGEDEFDDDGPEPSPTP
jgi:hypothetical protein